MRTFELTWHETVDPYAVHPNAPQSDYSLPRTIMADSYETVSGESGYPRIEFTRGGEIIATFFSFPMAIRVTEE